MPLHVINFTGPVTASTCSQLIEKASLAVQQEASGLVVNIATRGGDCSYGFTKYNFLLALPIVTWAAWPFHKVTFKNLRHGAASMDTESRFDGKPAVTFGVYLQPGANAVSAGPIKTLAASGIGNFGKLLAYNSHHAPLRRNVTIEEVGNAAAFLLSDLASGITGEIMYVDGGLNTTALGNADPMPA